MTIALSRFDTMVRPYMADTQYGNNLYIAKLSYSKANNLYIAKLS
jgi:hypothetical protein